MKLLTAAFKFYIHASIHVALAVVSFSLLTVFQNGYSTDYKLLYFTFFASLSGYNFIKEPSAFGNLLKGDFRTLRSHLPVSLVSGILAVYFLSKLEERVVIAVFVLFAVSFLYTVPLFGRSLRMISYTKMPVVALVWSGVTVLLPVFQESVNMNYDLWFTFVQRVLVIWVLTVPFEIRDLAVDSSSLITLPQRYGIRAVKWQATLAAIAVLLLEQVKFEPDQTQFIVTGIMLLLSVIMVWFSSIDQGKYYASFWVEGIPILWFSLAYVADHYPEISL